MQTTFTECATTGKKILLPQKACKGPNAKTYFTMQYRARKQLTLVCLISRGCGGDTDWENIDSALCKTEEDRTSHIAMQN